MQAAVRQQRAVSHVVKGRQRVLAVAVRQQQEGIGADPPHIPHVKAVPRGHRQRRAPPRHLLRHGQPQRPVARHQRLHLPAGAHRRDRQHAARFQTGAAAVGRHGDGVRAVCRPAAGRRRLHVQDHIQPLGVRRGDQIGQHVRAHHAPAQVRAALYHHGGQSSLRRVQQRGAVVAQGFRLRHRRVAEHVGEIFQYLLAEPRRIGCQRQRQRRFPLADAPLQFHVKHSRLLLSGAPLIRWTSKALYLFDCIL